MNRIRQTISLALVAAVLSLGLASAHAQTQRPYRISDRQVENALRRVEASADRFRASFSSAMDRSRWNGTSTEDQLNTYVQNFEQATDALRSRFNARTSVAADVENVLSQAAYLNDFMMRNRLDMRAMNDWTTLRANLDALARAYNVTWDWAQTPVAGYGSTGYGNTGAGAQTGVAYRIGDRQLDAVIRRIENGADRFPRASPTRSTAAATTARAPRTTSTSSYATSRRRPTSSARASTRATRRPRTWRTSCARPPTSTTS